MSQEYWRNNEQASDNSNSNSNSNSQQGYNQSYPQQQYQYGGSNDNYNQQYGYGSGPNEPPSYNNNNENQYYTQQQSYQSNEQWSSTSSLGKPPQQQTDQYGSNYDQEYSSSRPLPPGVAAQPGLEGQYPGAEGADGERGLMGALAGGAAGAYGGHKMGHGFLGAVGGAFAGHKLEEFAKEKHKANKMHEGEFGQQGVGPGPVQGEQHQGWGDKWNNISHEDKMKYGMGAAGLAAAGGAGYYAWHHHEQKQHHDGQVPVPGAPHHGHKEVLAGNFSESSTQITLDGDYDLIASCGTVDGRQKLSSIRLNDCLSNEWGHFKWMRNGGFAGSARNIRLVDDGRVLEAELGDGRGGWNRERIRLDERISNDNGELILLD